MAFEPIPETFDLLTRNLRRYQQAAQARITLENKGVTKRGGPEAFAFTYFPNLPGNSTQRIGEKDAQASHMRALFISPRRYADTVNQRWKYRCPLTRWFRWAKA